MVAALPRPPRSIRTVPQAANPDALQRTATKPMISIIHDTTYAARDLPFPDRATLAFLTRVVVADAESKCAAAAVSRDPLSDLVRISR
jgi:hypothetical protein